MVRIENWNLKIKPSDCLLGNIYNYFKLEGIVYGHPKIPDGADITTSKIIEIAGLYVQTKNTRYLLGHPSLNYLQWLVENDIEFNPNNPINLFF